MITAIVLIKANVHHIPETAQAVANIAGVTEVYSCAGDIDLIAKLRVRQHDEIASVVTDRINRLDGVESTSTHIAFREYSNAELDGGFDIGN